MPFWLHQSRFICMIKAIPCKYKVMTSGVLIISFVVIVIGGIYGSSKHRINQKNQELIALQAGQKKFFDITERYEKLILEYDQLVSQYNQISAPRRSLQQVIRSLLDMACQSGISCRGIQPQSGSQKAFYEKHCLSIRGKGNFKQILSFLDTVHKGNYVTKFKSLVIEKGKRDVLNFQCNVDVVSVKEVVNNVQKI